MKDTDIERYKESDWERLREKWNTCQKKVAIGTSFKYREKCIRGLEVVGVVMITVVIITVVGGGVLWRKRKETERRKGRRTLRVLGRHMTAKHATRGSAIYPSGDEDKLGSGGWRTPTRRGKGEGGKGGA